MRNSASMWVTVCEGAHVSALLTVCTLMGRGGRWGRGEGVGEDEGKEGTPRGDGGTGGDLTGPETTPPSPPGVCGVHVGPSESLVLPSPTTPHRLKFPTRDPSVDGRKVRVWGGVLLRGRL